MRRLMRNIIGSAAAALVVSGGLSAQDRAMGAATIAHHVHGFGTTARVLMIGAHPDDEDTALISWLARGRQVETAYLSLTRGDGGQNLIGNELGESLGAIRTEELLAARRIDFGRQYFTRAYDFGYSKDSAETLMHWPREELLGDVVRVVRAFRPQVIVAVFSGTARDGHGHHQVSGILAREAYDLAGDTVRFPVGEYGAMWTPAKFYRAARFAPQGSTTRMNIGEFDVIAGRSYGEIAGESRSQHKSQGFGAAERRGVLFDYVRREATRVNAAMEATAEQGMFDGVDTTWARHRAAPQTPAVRALLDSMPMIAQAARAALDLRAPSTVVPILARAVALLENALTVTPCRNVRTRLPCSEAASDLAASVRIAHERATTALIAAAGVQLEALADRGYLAWGDTAEATLRVDNRGVHTVTVHRFAPTGYPLPGNTASVVVAPDSSFAVTRGMTAVPPMGAWWLMTQRQSDMFEGFSTESEDARATTYADLQLEIAGARFTYRMAPLVQRKVDPVAGETRTPMTPVPAVSLLFDRTLEVARASTSIDRIVRMQARSYSTRPRTIRLRFELPPGMTPDPLPDTMTLGPLESREIAIRMRGVLPEGKWPLTVSATEVQVDDAGGRFNGTARYAAGFFTLTYPHIRPLVLFRPSGVWVQGIVTQLPATGPIAYIPGVSDEVATILRQLDLPVTDVAPEQVASTDLSRFKVIVLGPRVYQRAPALAELNTRLEEFARQGGTVVVQYGQAEMQRIGMLPYMVEMMPPERVTMEDAPVRVLDPRARVLNTPNTIDSLDFSGWVQERAIYMPSSVDSAWTTVLEMNDPGERPNPHGLLIAKVGAGSYVYTSLSLFRQVPAGIPGAIRLFINLVAVRTY